MDTSNKLASKFNIENYSGLLPEHVVPEYIKNIEEIFAELPENSDEKKAIDTYLRLLRYYDEVSRKDSPIIQEALRYCDELQTFLNEYAKNKYPEYNITINLKGRIKSPVSAINKFKSSINEYIQDNKNLDKLLIRDLLAFKLVIDVKDKNEIILDDDIAAPICYDITSQALIFSNQYQNISIKSSRQPTKPSKPPIHDIYTIKDGDIPEEVLNILKQYEGYYKDFVINYKEDSNYQSIHIILELKLPNSNTPLLFEMQLKTYRMNEHAERGPGSHKTYKSRNQVNFLRVPQIFEKKENNPVDFIDMDNAFSEFFNFYPEDINPDMTYDNLLEFLKSTNFENPIRLLTFKILNDNEMIFNDPAFLETQPIEIVNNNKGKDSHLEAIVLNIFVKEKIKPELDELGSH